MIAIESHQRVFIHTEFLIAARQGDESRFARLLGLEDDKTEVTINTDKQCIPRDEPDFLLGVTYTGNSLLHLAASSNFLDLAEKIWRREKSLLTACNKVLETPLHCAAKNGNQKMVSFFIKSASEMGGDTMKEVLRARNKDGETALHEAARHNHATVASLLINADPGLASVIDHQGISAFYLATTSGYLDVVHEMIQGLIRIEVSKACYAGPDGQTALHAAVLRSKEMTEVILKWKPLGPLLAKMPDNSGSTPLHFAASYGYDKIAQVLLNHDHSLAYIYDSSGSFSVHVAAKMGHVGVISAIIDHCPDSDELLDAKGRNFLHVAAQEGQRPVVGFICRTISKHKSMKNARDNDGNTPLHLAIIDSENEHVIKQLMQDKEVSINIFNKEGLTLRDLSAIATFKDNAISPTFQKVNFWIERSTEMLGAYYGARRWDQFTDKYTTKEDAEQENKKLTNEIQTIGLGSVLIATATFAAAFALPGGYRADDHPKSGSPTLAHKYAFSAFLVSDAMAFMLAFHSTMILLFRGVTSSKPHLKKKFVSVALWFIILASRCTVLSFSLAIFVVLSPVNKLLGILIVVGAVIFQYDGFGRDYGFTTRVISQRQGLKQLFQKKLPEATLRHNLPAAWFRYVLSFIMYCEALWLPIVFTAVVPLIMSLLWDCGKFVGKHMR